jgi:lysophospholipase L1-like esterase
MPGRIRPVWWRPRVLGAAGVLWPGLPEQLVVYRHQPCGQQPVSRILAHNPAIAGHAANYAVTAVSASNLPAQAGLAAGQGAELVTVDIGINDACAPLGSNGGQQTPPTTLAAEVQLRRRAGADLR